MSLPLVNISEIDLNGYLFVNFPFEESMKRSLMKTEMRIISCVEEDIKDIVAQKRWGSNADYSERALDEYRKDSCVISPLTLYRASLYDVHQKTEKMSPAQVEAEVIKVYRGRFAPRFKENMKLYDRAKNDILYETIKEIQESLMDDA